MSPPAPHPSRMARRSGPRWVAAWSVVAVTIAIAGRSLGAPAASCCHAELEIEPAQPAAGQPALLRFTIKDTLGRAIRFLQFVHERPMHLIVVSRDLAEFAHIHPE